MCICADILLNLRTIPKLNINPMLLNFRNESHNNYKKDVASQNKYHPQSPMSTATVSENLKPHSLISFTRPF